MTEKQTETEELTGEELLERWEEQNKVYRYEGELGVRHLEELVQVLGYGMMFGGPLDNFLIDNPGCLEAMRDWVAEHVDEVRDWRDALLEATDEEETDVEACPGCGCKPGDGLTVSCDHPDGCGYTKAMEREKL